MDPSPTPGRPSGRRRQGAPLLVRLATASVSAVILHGRINLLASELRHQRHHCTAPGTCALLPAPLSRPLARAPSTSSDRWHQAQSSVSILTEPVERPLSRYLYKKDSFYNRIVPDWDLQFKTMQQQFFYEGDFSLFVKELTDDGAVVQDITTGAFGWVPKAEFGTCRDLLPGDTIHGARCTFLDNTVIESPDPEILRMQTGIVYEWDEANGEGYIIPSEGQDAWNMIRVLRRDIRWHDSRRLFPGQFVQFDTALPDEVPIEANDDPSSPFALKVRGLEVRFSLASAYDLIPEGGQADELLLEGAAPLPDEESSPPQLESGEEDSVALQATSESEAVDTSMEVHLEKRDAFPVSPARPELKRQKKAHPLLQRFAAEAPAVAEAESPSWLWEPQLDYLKEERYDPIIPIQIQKPKLKPKRIRILTHEEAVKRGDTWQEAKQRQGARDFQKLMPPGRAQVERMSRGRHLRNIAREKAEIRFAKKRLATYLKQRNKKLQQ
eukprot:TRINITY_DN36479_c0_g1_i1.p1 TRINITY_DN36479_c0_g1~~TRINITY_DN36479_c0_g1_i1.p1  ORF type:complete len:511 (+),score=106.34 TRINITY_DN36479_c0_g1_i1:44-1534(+)